ADRLLFPLIVERNSSDQFLESYAMEEFTGTGNWEEITLEAPFGPEGVKLRVIFELGGIGTGSFFLDKAPPKFIVGPAGPTRPAGPSGRQGPQGSSGPIGPTGTKGPTGPTGATGPVGFSGVEQVSGTIVKNAENKTATAECPSGKVVINGGYNVGGN